MPSYSSKYDARRGLERRLKRLIGGQPMLSGYVIKERLTGRFSWVVARSYLYDERVDVCGHLIVHPGCPSNYFPWDKKVS